MPRSLILAAAAACAAAAAAAPAGTAAVALTGSVGPGFTITLKKLGKRVTTLKAGTYAITVSDRSAIHDFHLKGPGVNRVITTVPFVGRKTVVLRLRKGTYTFVCDPHFTTMKGTFVVR